MPVKQSNTIVTLTAGKKSRQAVGTAESGRRAPVLLRRLLPHAAENMYEMLTYVR